MIIWKLLATMQTCQAIYTKLSHGPAQNLAALLLPNWQQLKKAKCFSYKRSVKNMSANIK